MTKSSKLSSLSWIRTGLGTLAPCELADGIKRIRGDVTFDESIALALDRVARFDKDGNAKLDLDEFKEYAKTMCEGLGTTFHGTCGETMLYWVVDSLVYTHY